MGAVDTTYTFTATDTITSTKMNNIIDQTTMTGDAIIGTTLEVASGKLKVRAAGITSNEMASNSVVTAAITDSNVTTAKIADSNVTTAKIADANVTQSKLADNIAGNGPAFFAWDSVGTTCLSGIVTKINLDTEDFDTNGNFSSSRFTPTIAGYYFITASIAFSSPRDDVYVSIYKNGTLYTGGSQVPSDSTRSNCSSLIYLNGTTDFIEMYGWQNSGTTASSSAARWDTFMSGFLARSA